MKQTKVSCDQCKREGRCSIRVEYGFSTRDELDFCDRHCLIEFFEKNEESVKKVTP